MTLTGMPMDMDNWPQVINWLTCPWFIAAVGAGVTAIILACRSGKRIVVSVRIDRAEVFLMRPNDGLKTKATNGALPPSPQGSQG